jgi:hypothetical protein
LRRWSRPRRRSSPLRVLLDECLPRRLKRELVGHDAGTVDRNLSYQQDVSDVDIAVVVLVPRSNTIDELRPLVPQVLEAFATAKRRAVTMVGA